MTLRRREGVGDHGRHKIEDGVLRGDPCQRPLREGRVTSTLRERTGLEELADGYVTLGGFAFALARFHSLGFGALGELLLGDFYLGPCRKINVSRETEEKAMTYQQLAPREEERAERPL